METLTDLIEREKREFDTFSEELFVGEDSAYPVSIYLDDMPTSSRKKLHAFLTTAMQRAYEAGVKERDTYWKERVYSVVSEWVTHNAKTIQHNNRVTEYIEVRELLTLLDNLK